MKFLSGLLCHEVVDPAGTLWPRTVCLSRRPPQAQVSHGQRAQGTLKKLCVQSWPQSTFASSSVPALPHLPRVLSDGWQRLAQTCLAVLDSVLVFLPPGILLCIFCHWCAAQRSEVRAFFLCPLSQALSLSPSLQSPHYDSGTFIIFCFVLWHLLLFKNPLLTTLAMLLFMMILYYLLSPALCKKQASDKYLKS